MAQMERIIKFADKVANRIAKAALHERTDFRQEGGKRQMKQNRAPFQTESNGDFRPPSQIFARFSETGGKPHQITGIVVCCRLSKTQGFNHF